MGATEPSLLSSAAASESATDLSRATGRTSYSIPDDGREVTIQPNRRRRREREAAREALTSNGSTLSHPNTSLLIEYFEQENKNGTERRPSVRVKVTPQNPKRRGTKEKDGEDRLHPFDERSRAVAERAKRGVTQRTYSGGQSSISEESGASYGKPVNVTVIREAGSPGSFVSSPREIDDYKKRPTRRGTGDSYFDKDGKESKSRRSRSISYGSENTDDASWKGAGLQRRKSRSVSPKRNGVQTRGSMSRREKKLIEQGVREELERLRNPKSRKNRSSSRVKTYDEEEDGLKPPRGTRARSRSRSRSRSRDRSTTDELTAEKARARRKAELLEAESNVQSRVAGSAITNPELYDLIQDTIKKLLPEIVEMKRTNSQVGRPNAATSETKKTASTNTLGKPKVVLSPGSEDGHGLSVMLSNNKDHSTEDDTDHSRAPGFGPINSPVHSERNEGVSLVGVDSKASGQHLRMPDGPGRFDSPNSGAETRASIRTSKSAAAEAGNPPYPPSAEVSGMPSSGTTPPPANWNNNKRASERNASGVPLDNDYDNARNELNYLQQKRNLGQQKSDSAVRDFVADQREKAQDRAIQNGLRDNSVDVYHVSTDIKNSGGYDDDQFRDLATGQLVHSLGANPSMRSTPVAAYSAHASVVQPSNVDGFSNLSMRPTGSQPKMGHSAIPLPDDPMPALSHIMDDDDEDINTNPSIIQGPIHGRPTEWDIDQSQPVGDLGPNVTLNRGMSISDVGYDGLDQEMMRNRQQSRTESGIASPQNKDEGYISAANPLGSPATASPMPGNLENMLMNDDFYSQRRVGSTNSQGMTSPLYDTSNTGAERIQSKDIIALMEHLTVRDAQRNARDTEILVTLVRSAAELRNSFEDIKRAMADQTKTIVSQVDENTERSVQKVLQGPRPLPPSAPRRRERDSLEDEVKKKSNVFRRALKGLSGRSSSDLERIQDMLYQLLDDMEDMRDLQEHQYRRSVIEKANSQGSAENKSMPDDQNYQNGSPSMSGAAVRGPSKIKFQDELQDEQYQQQPQSQPQQKDQQPRPIPRAISPIDENEVHNSPPRTREMPPDSPPVTSPATQTRNIIHLGGPKSDTKSKRESGGSSSLFPKISRWSETTASSGLMKAFLGKGKSKEYEDSDPSRSNSEFNYWDTEQANRNPPESYASPFGSDHTGNQRPPSPLLPPDNNIPKANRRSLDLQHPRPRPVVNNQLEIQAQRLAESGAILSNPANNASVSSLGNFPPFEPGGFQGGQLLSPLAKEAYTQHQKQTSPLRQQLREQPSTSEPTSSTTGGSPRKQKKHRTPEEKAARRAKKEQRAREKELAAAEGDERRKSTGVDQPQVDRMASTASRLTGPRPLSQASFRRGDRESFSNDFGNEDSNWVTYR